MHTINGFSGPNIQSELYLMSTKHRGGGISVCGSLSLLLSLSLSLSLCPIDDKHSTNKTSLDHKPPSLSLCVSVCVCSVDDKYNAHTTGLDNNKYITYRLGPSKNITNILDEYLVHITSIIICIIYRSRVVVQYYHYYYYFGYYHYYYIWSHLITHHWLTEIEYADGK